jgi:hypothetical protein
VIAIDKWKIGCRTPEPRVIASVRCTSDHFVDIFGYKGYAALQLQLRRDFLRLLWEGMGQCQ